MEKEKTEKVIPVPDYSLAPLPLIEKTGSFKEHKGVTFIAGEGTAPSDIMFIASCVSPQEASKYIKGRYGEEGVRVQPRYLRSDAGVMFSDIFSQEGLDINKFYYTALVKWLLPKNERIKVPKDIVSWALPSLDEEIKKVKPKIIVCIGKPIFDLLSDIKLSLSDAKSGWFYNSKYDTKIYLIDDIFKLVTNPEYIEKFRTEAKEINRMYQEIINVNVKKTDLNYSVISNSNDLKNLVKTWKDGNFNVISVDCEWAGSNHIDGKLRSTQFCWAPGHACYVRWMDDKGNYVFDIDYASAGSILASWLNLPNVKYIGHHFAADAPWLHHVLGLDWYEKCIFDTEFALQTANEAEDLSLERLALKYTDLGRYDLDLVLWVKNNKAIMVDGGYGAIPDDILIPYACLRQESLIQLGDGSWCKIKDLVNKKYSGEVRALLDGKVQNCKVTNWYKTNTQQKDWRKLVTKYAQKGKHGYLGPVLTPDHKVLTQRGKVAVQDLVPGTDSIQTAYNTFSDMQLSVFLGCLLGDGGIAQRNSAHAGVVLSQCLRRIEYLKWKVKVLFGDSENVTCSKSHATYYSAYSPYIAHLSDVWCRKKREDHCRRKLLITEDVLNQLKAPGLAVWYQDDGTFTSDCEVRITIYHLCDEELKILSSWFDKTLGIKVKYRQEQNHICFSVEDSAKFLNYIRHYIHPSCGYKTNLPCDLKLDHYEPGSLYLEPIVSVINVDSKPCSGDGIRYCLAVDKAENFLTKSGFVSNCKDVDTVFRAWPAIYKSLQFQDLVEYYEKIFHPFVTDVFVSFALVGLPMDIEMMDELRELYTFARDKMEVTLREDIYNEAKHIVLRAIMIRAPEEIAADIYSEFASAVAVDEHDRAWLTLKSTASKPDDVPKLKYIFDHFIESGNFNIRSPAHLKRWLFNVKGYEPVKSTSNKEKGLPATSWEKVKSMPPEAQKNYNPAVDKQTLQILSEKNNDKILRKLLQLNAVGNICKAFLKEADIDEEGNVIKENGLHYFLCSDRHVHGQMSTTETGRPRSWKPNSLNWPSYVNGMISNGIADLFGRIKERNELPEKFDKFVVKDDKGEYKSKIPSIRSCVKAPEGWCFVESDYQTAEIRGLAFISGDRNLIDIVCNPDLNFAIDSAGKNKRLSFPGDVFPASVQEKYKDLLISPDDPSLLRKEDGSLKHPKQDLHWSLAEMVHIKPREVLDEKKDRGAAKVGNFCISEDELVLTHKGLKPIQHVSDCDLLWDGVEWVSHEGVIYSGEKEVIEYQGLAATRLHDVWTREHGKIKFGEAFEKQINLIRSEETCRNFENTKLADISRYSEEERQRILCRLDALRSMRSGKMERSKKYGKRILAKMSMSESSTYNFDSPWCIKESETYIRREISSYETALRERYSRILREIQTQRNKSRVFFEERILFMGIKTVARRNVRKERFRQNRQLRKLFKKQSTSCGSVNEFNEPRVYALNTYRACTAVHETIPEYKIYGKNYIRFNPLRFDYRRNIESSHAKPKSRMAKVYDIINAGPRNRFTCQGVLVSNSSAYGASASTLERKIEQDTGKKPEDGTGERLLRALEKRQPVAQDFLIKMERVPAKPGYYRAASGRIRHFVSHDPKYADDLDEYLTLGLFRSMGREARNFPMQESVAATAARAGKWLLDAYIKLKLKARPLIILYDSVVTLCPLEERFKVAQLHQLYMTDLNAWEYHGRKLVYPIDQLFCYRWSCKPSKEESILLNDANWKV